LKSGIRTNGDRIILAQPVMLGGGQEGTLSLLADLRATTSQLLKLYGSIFTLVLLASLLSRSFFQAILALRHRSDPSPADAARTVADHNDYSVRATKACNDEVGVLTDAFQSHAGSDPVAGQQAARQRGKTRPSPTHRSSRILGTRPED